MTKKEIIIECLGRGMSYDEAAEKSKSPVSSVRWYASKLKLNGKNGKKTAKAVEKKMTKKEIIIECLGRGMSYDEAAEKSKSPVSSVRWYASKLKLNGKNGKKTAKAVEKKKTVVKNAERGIEKKKTKNVNDLIHELANFAICSEGVKKERYLGELIKHIEPKLKFFVWKFFNNSYDTEDVINNVIEKIITKFHTFNPDYRFTTWAYTIAYREAITHKNKKNRDCVTEFNESFDKGVTNAVDHENLQIKNMFGEKLMLEDIYNTVLSIVCKMPESVNKNIFIDKRINKMKGVEVAKKYGLPENTIKTKVKKVTDDLKREMAREIPDMDFRIIL